MQRGHQRAVAVDGDEHDVPANQCRRTGRDHDQTGRECKQRSDWNAAPPRGEVPTGPLRHGSLCSSSAANAMDGHDALCAPLARRLRGTKRVRVPASVHRTVRQHGENIGRIGHDRSHAARRLARPAAAQLGRQLSGTARSALLLRPRWRRSRSSSENTSGSRFSAPATASTGLLTAPTIYYRFAR